MASNRQIVEEILACLPRDFYGQVELNFHRGLILYCKTTTTKKFNPESNTTGVTDGQGNGKSATHTL